MGDETIDSVARDKAEKAMTVASLAKQAIDGHKINCAERWDVARSAMGDVKVQIERVESRQRAGWRWIIGLIIAGQGSALLLLLTLLAQGAS